MRVIGVDIGKISFKTVWLENRKIKDVFWQVHQQEIQKIWQKIKERWQIGERDRVTVTGRLRQMLPFPSIVERVVKRRQLVSFIPEKK